MNYKRLIALLIIALTVQRCAKQTAPTGGAKDETPPKLIRSTPAHEAIMVTSNELQLTFDELVQVNNPREQIIITPNVGKKFETTAKKNKVIIKLNSTLQPNTTYNINFRESIQDLTEKNPATAKIAFSTGSYIDSLMITGSVRDILSDKAVSNYTVGLTEASDTFNIFKHSAPWITLTDKQGKFTLENLKQGTYFIYAYDDKNKNLIVDSKSEKYAFKSESITLNKNIDSIALTTFKLDTSPIRLISSRPTFSYFNIKLSKSVTDYSLTTLPDSIKLYSIVDSDLSSIKVYNSLSEFDSLQIHLQVTDSIDSKIDTLIYLKFNKKESTKDKFSVKIESCNLFEDKSLLSSVISFSKPVPLFNSDSVYIQLDSINRATFSQNDFIWNKSLTKLTLSKKHELKQPEKLSKLKEENKPRPTGPREPKQSPTNAEEQRPTRVYNQLILAKSSIISVEYDTATQLSATIKNIKEQETGIIITKVETTENFTLQLLGINLQLIEEIKNEKDYSFTNLTPGKYLLRLIIDKNNNGKWDPANFQKKSDSEPILFYTNPKSEKEINLKANWTIGPLLIAY